MSRFTLPMSHVLLHKELLMDAYDAASAIEDEFAAVFVPYTKGWYRRGEDTPFMPLVSVKGKPLWYHMKGGTLLAPWDEQITVVADPNTADRNVYNEDGNLMFEVKHSLSSKRFTPSSSSFFTTRPVMPLRGLELMREYTQWVLDSSCLWRKTHSPLEHYVKHLFEPSALKAAEVLEVDYELIETRTRPSPSKVSDNNVPKTIRGNKIMESLVDRLCFYCQEMRLILDAFAGNEEWQTYSVELKAHRHLFLKMHGDYRILEWTRLKKEGKIK